MSATFGRFIQSAKKIALRQKDKDFVRESLLLYMQEHPLGGTQSPRGIRAVLRYLVAPKRASVLLGLLFFVAGGTSLAAGAEGSLPGDVLYPVKVHVNERVGSSLLFSHEAKANWETALAGKRLKEVEILASRGRFGSEARVVVASALEKHTQRVHGHVEDLQQKKDFERAMAVASELEALAKAHKKILEQLAREDQETEFALQPIVAKMSVVTKNAWKDRTDMEARFSQDTQKTAKEGAQAKLRSAARAVKEVEKFLDKHAFSQGSILETETKITLAKTVLAQGEAKVRAKSYGEAFILFQEAFRITQEIKLRLEAQKNFKIDFFKES